ncbi:MAG: hypothetical protein JW751_20100 [Polyangiaceae bacterium]|nr:hypothetical protein [Polyangiaceae bacterium]
MLLSRFWYVVLSMLLGAAIFVLFLAQSMYNRSGEHAMAEGLASDAQFVSWYLRNDARERSGQLIQFALDGEIQKGLQKSSLAEEAVPKDVPERVEAALKKINGGIPADFSFDAVFAVDRHGRVVAHLGYDQARGMDDFELGGYPVVADALHGYLRDDTLVLDRMYRVVARPVEHEIGSPPAGAIIGARIIDDRYARNLTERTGAAVAFFTRGTRVASGAPEDFDKSQLDLIIGDMEELGQDPEYAEKGRSGVRRVGLHMGVVYARIPGEAYSLGAGYAVARVPANVESPLGFFKKADDKDKASANLGVVAGVALLAILLGLLFSYLEHTRPLHTFRTEAAAMAKGKSDQLLPSKFRGVFRKIASDLNDGIDQVAAKGGVPRRAADLKQVLGDLPAEPQMSAFSFPGDGAAQAGAPPPEPKARALPTAPAARKLPPVPARAPGGEASAPEVGQSPRNLPKPPGAGVEPGEPEAERLAEWHRVFDEFVAVKQQCGESTEGFTYEKFEQTLRKNEDTLRRRHGAARVRFSVYVKEGKAALKASPIKE